MPAIDHPLLATQRSRRNGSSSAGMGGAPSMRSSSSLAAQIWSIVATGTMPMSACSGNHRSCGSAPGPESINVRLATRSGAAIVASRATRPPKE